MTKGWGWGTIVCKAGKTQKAGDRTPLFCCLSSGLAVPCMLEDGLGWSQGGRRLPREGGCGQGEVGTGAGLWAVGTGRPHLSTK